MHIRIAKPILKVIGQKENMFETSALSKYPNL